MDFPDLVGSQNEFSVVPRINYGLPRHSFAVEPPFQVLRMSYQNTMNIGADEMVASTCTTPRQATYGGAISHLHELYMDLHPPVFDTRVDVPLPDLSCVGPLSRNGNQHGHQYIMRPATLTKPSGKTSKCDERYFRHVSPSPSKFVANSSYMDINFRVYSYMNSR